MSTHLEFVMPQLHTGLLVGSALSFNRRSWSFTQLLLDGDTASHALRAFDTI